MRQSDLNRAAARATGETIDRVARIGFLISDPALLSDDPDDEQFGPTVIDWDARVSDAEGGRAVRY